MFSLANRTIVVTGAAGHLGQAITHGILESGGTTILVGRSSGKLDQFRDSMSRTTAERCHIFATDISDETALAALADQIANQFREIHGVVNNAYAGKVGNIASLLAADFAMASVLNLSSPFLLSRALEPQLSRGAEGTGTSSSIVNIASMYGKVSPDPSIYGDTGANNPAHYGATKAGLIQLTRYLACHLNPGRIRVNSISPGPFPASAASNKDDPFLEQLRKKVPMARLGDAKEIAGPVVFLLSTASCYVTGADLAVDGGWTAW